MAAIGIPSFLKAIEKTKPDQFKPHASNVDPLSEEIIPNWRIVGKEHQLNANTWYMVRQTLSEVVFYFFWPVEKEKNAPQNGILFSELGIRVGCTVPTQFNGSQETEAMSKVLISKGQTSEVMTDKIRTSKERMIAALLNSVKDSLVREHFIEQHVISKLPLLKPESSPWKPHVKIGELNMHDFVLPSQNPHK